MEQRNFKTSGLRVGQFQGIELWLHWSLLVWFAYLLYLVWILQLGWKALGIWMLWSGGTFFWIFLHELGHVYAAIRMGGGADAIVLWPLGGLAYCDVPRFPRIQFWVAAAGPLVNLVIAIVLGVCLLILSLALPLNPKGFSLVPAIGGGSALLPNFLEVFLWWNIVLLVFNLLPVYPLDGGRMFQALAWERLQSFGRATMATVWASRITIFAVFILSFFFRLEVGRWWLFIILIWAFYQTELLRHRAQAEEEDYLFGYDFSRGYTSLQRTVVQAERRVKKPSLLQRFKRYLQKRRREKHEALKQQVDVLLEKISRSGMSSLSARERRFLEGASRRLKGNPKS